MCEYIYVYSHVTMYVFPYTLGALGHGNIEQVARPTRVEGLR